MASLSLINRVKYSKTIFSIYNYLGSKAISLLKLFLSNDKQLIIFASFGGRKFDDSPKAVYEAMIADPRFDEYKLVWAFMRPEDYTLPRGEKIKIDTLKYYITLLKAGVWVHNSSMTRGLNFTGISTFELNSWHGSAIKRMGSDINSGNKSFGLKEEYGKKNHVSVMLAQGQYDVDVFTRAFSRPKESFRVIGLPRNDELARVTAVKQGEMKERLGISPEKKVLLYAPTFREYEKDGANNCVMAPPIDLKKWESELGDNYVLLFRAHYEVAKVMGVKDDDFVKNVSSYPSLDDLMVASDILISDYSSIFFDYAIQGKPMLSFAYDYDRYEKERGIYFDIRKELDCYIDNEEDLLREIKMMDVPKREEVSKTFRDKYVESYGNASLQSLDIIYDAIHHKE